MSERKTFVVVRVILQQDKCGCVDEELQSVSEDAARKAALARGWLPIKVYEKKELKAA